jgi:hypothetical protein
MPEFKDQAVRHVIDRILAVVDIFLEDRESPER